MYTFFRGIVDEVFTDALSLDVQGVGYFISVSREYSESIVSGMEIKIYTTMIHREDSMKLYGFRTKSERQLFELLLSVSGIGAKTAMGIISAFGTTEIISCIYSENNAKLAKAPGVGPKTAQRIILELKEKIKSLKTEIIFTQAENINDQQKIEQYEETEAALTALGYNNSEINQTLRWLNENQPNLSKSDDLIKEALQLLAKI